MILKELKQLIKCRESEVLEFKQSTGQRSRAAETLCAMLNGKGGSVVFGITDDLKLAGQHVSDSTLSDLSAEICLTFKLTTPQVTPNLAPQVPPQVARLVRAAKGEHGRDELMRTLGLKDGKHFRSAYLNPAIESGLIEKTNPDNPRSSRQKYRLTAKGECFLDEGVERTALEVYSTPQVTPQVAPQVASVLAIFSGEHSRDELMRMLGLKDGKYFRSAYLNPAIESGLIEMTNPDNPRSSRQKYRLTAKGIELKNIISKKVL